MTAAVADWRPAEAAPEKLKDKATRTAIELVANPDILAELSKAGPDRPRLVIGFAAETEKLIEHARGKLTRKGCDWIVANDVGGTGVMGGDANTVTVLDADGEEAWPTLSKAQVAERLAQRIATAASGASRASFRTPGAGRSRLSRCHPANTLTDMTGVTAPCVLGRAAGGAACEDGRCQRPVLILSRATGDGDETREEFVIHEQGQ